MRSPDAAMNSSAHALDKLRKTGWHCSSLECIGVDMACADRASSRGALIKVVACC